MDLKLIENIRKITGLEGNCGFEILQKSKKKDGGLDDVWI